MNRVIPITVRNKIATIGNRDAYYVCGNSDFRVVFEFDDDWAEHSVKTARFSYEGKFQDILFEGNECFIPYIIGTKYLDVGVFAGDLLSSTPARVRAKESILCQGSIPEPPSEDVYNQLIGMYEELEKKIDTGGGTGGEGFSPIAVVEQDYDGARITITDKNGTTTAKAYNGQDGISGQDGYTPVRGTDYWTDEDKAEIKSYVDEAILGGAW